MLHEQGLRWYHRIILGVALMVALFPVFWSVSTSLKPPNEWVSNPPVWISAHATLDNYRAVFDPASLTGEGLGRVNESAARAIWGSLLTSLSSTFLSVVIGLMAALAISRYRVGGNTTPFVILSGRMFPPIAIAIPIVIMFSFVRMIDSYFGLIIVYTAFTIPFSTWMIKSFLDEIPKEIEEAAMVDGLSTPRAYMEVTIPLIKGGIGATSLFIFILNWSEFLMALVLSRSNINTIPFQLSKYFGATMGTLYGVQAALGILAVIPLVFFGMMIQDYLVRGITFGAIKR